MVSGVPVIDLPLLHKRLETGKPEQKFILHRFSSGSSPLWEPCRMEVYFIALLHQGEVFVETDLFYQKITAPALFAMAPSVIRKFIKGSTDFSSEVIFFEKSFFQKHLADARYLDQYHFFSNGNDHLISVSQHQYLIFRQYFSIINQRAGIQEPFGSEIVRNFISILLTEIAVLYPSRGTKPYTYREEIVHNFKSNLEANYRMQKKVTFYASLQHLSAKYFSSAIQSLTGRSVGDMIDDRVMLEAFVLLQNKALTIAEIANILGFTDASNFSKYFKHLAGCSPRSYRSQGN